VARDEFFFTWLVVVTLLLVLGIAGAVLLVWRSGVLSGEVSLVSEPNPQGLSGALDADSESHRGVLRDAFSARVYCIDPEGAFLASEERQIKGAPNNLARMLNVLEALRETPSSENFLPAVPPEVQFRTLFFEPEGRTIYVDLVDIPESWQGEGAWLEVGLCLNAITHTLTGLSAQFEKVRFLVDGQESESSPGGFVLSEVFVPSSDWLDPQLVR